MKVPCRLTTSSLNALFLLTSLIFAKEVEDNSTKSKDDNLQSQCIDDKRDNLLICIDDKRPTLTNTINHTNDDKITVLTTCTLSYCVTTTSNYETYFTYKDYTNDSESILHDELFFTFFTFFMFLL